jgi:hypothetical protein
MCPGEPSAARRADSVLRRAVPFHGNIVRLHGARCAPAVFNQFFQKRLHLPDPFRFRRRQVGFFRKIRGKVVQLNRWRSLCLRRFRLVPGRGSLVASKMNDTGGSHGLGSR